tara:strand:+ start:252 stop:2024 length:1773 start_codon:yes stop_codon:yes gene_type:complete
MAALNFGDLLKVFSSGPLKGKKRYAMIIKKVKEKTPFILATGDTKILEYISSSVRTKFQSGNLAEIASVAAQRNKPLKDEEGQTYSIRQLEKTEEFGGKTGGGKPGGGADPHELMTAALIAKYGASGGSKVPVSAYNTLPQAEKNLTILKAVAATVDGKRQKDIDAFDGDFENYAKAISAANGFLGAMQSSSRVKKVFITGKKWSQEVAKYRVTNHEYFGKKDYNSSDIVVDLASKRNSKPFRILVGISLKKKKRTTDKDPTIINKSVSGDKGLFQAIIDANNLSKMRNQLKELYQARAQFFYNVIEATLYGPETGQGIKIRNEAVKSLSIPDGTKESVAYTKQQENKLRGAAPSIIKEVKRQAQTEAERLKEKALQENIAKYLKNLKKNVSQNEQMAKKVTVEANKLGSDRAKDALIQKFPYHTKIDNIYFRKLFSIMTDTQVTQYIATALMNIVFKLDIKSLMKDRQKYNEEFKFTLITGAGQLVNDVEITPFSPSVMPEENSTSMIAEMVSRPGQVYQMRGLVGYRQPHEGGTSKSLKFELILQGYSIVDIEIRYKGGITPEPQFQVYITPTFKKLLKDRVAPDVRY